ncbi:hypothetical protein FA09DRAFT_244520 [Tilletiopsis washingtonensis]|uniref:Uncharacterized protein n=1 Tax=Tilletiopsis washingtonensis TaxID=58919 RepID=A0A316ZCA7_9BASI|nr:hypothetical protein FA09DRAFT_244520 [Tilletiopsis washingtonensis]PWN99181.1 hypothetical protein FA09DRAFT_244520 [Tilletiopsis washingtonensis]
MRCVRSLRTGNAACGGRMHSMLVLPCSPELGLRICCCSCASASPSSVVHLVDGLQRAFVPAQKASRRPLPRSEGRSGAELQIGCRVRSAAGTPSAPKHRRGCRSAGAASILWRHTGAEAAASEDARRSKWRADAARPHPSGAASKPAALPSARETRGAACSSSADEEMVCGGECLRRRR